MENPKSFRIFINGDGIILIDKVISMIRDYHF